MPRTQSFDRDSVVRAARSVFWELGYEGASIPTLEAATKIRRSSLYNAFGSKRELFDTAVQSYLDEVVRPRLGPLLSADVQPDALTAYLTGLREAFERLDSMPASSGCLLVNTAGDPIARDPQVARVIADYRDELHSAVGRGLAARRPAPPASRLDDIAEGVTALIVSAFALARVDAAQAARNLSVALRMSGD